MQAGAAPKEPPDRQTLRMQMRPLQQGPCVRPQLVPRTLHPQASDNARLVTLAAGLRGAEVHRASSWLESTKSESSDGQA